MDNIVDHGIVNSGIIDCEADRDILRLQSGVIIQLDRSNRSSQDRSYL